MRNNDMVRIALAMTAAFMTLAVAGCGSGSHAPAQSAGDPARYQSWLPRSTTVKQLATGLCASYGAEMRSWAESGLRAGGGADFHDAMHELARDRLEGVATRQTAISVAMVDDFLKDSLRLCHKLSKYNRRRASLEGNPLVAAPQPPPPMPYWTPFRYDPTMQYHVGSHGCTLIRDDDARCFVLRVKSDYPCTSVYAEINLENKYGKVIDSTNAWLVEGTLEPGQSGRLEFAPYLRKNVKYWTLTKLTCSLP